MKKSIEKITYCFVIIAALFVSFVSFVEPLVMKDINITKVILVLLCYAAVFAGSLTLFRRLSERTLYYLTIAGIFAAVIVQTYIVFHMRLVPEVDLNHIYDYCVDMVETGKISFGESKYFAYNTNNIPLAIVIYYVFRMAAFTGMDYRIAGGLFNVLLILVMYVSAFLILKKVTTIRTTAVYMVLLLTNPSFYAYAISRTGYGRCRFYYLRLLQEKKSLEDDTLSCCRISDRVCNLHSCNQHFYSTCGWRLDLAE